MRKNRLNRLLAMALTVVILPLAGRAAVHTWSGASTTSANWSDAANWDSAIATGDSLIFSGSTQTVNANDLTGLSLGWLQFANDGFTLSGNALTINTGVTNVAGANNLGMVVSVPTAQFWDIAAGSSVAVSGGLSLAAPLTFVDDGDSTISAAIAGTGSLTKNGTGTMTISAGSAYTGGTVVNGGLLVCSTGGWYAARGIGTGPLTVNAGATAEFQAAHYFGVDPTGRPASIYGGTLQFDHENYVSTLVLSNATIAGSNGAGELRNGSPTAIYVITSTDVSTITVPLLTVSYNSTTMTLDVTNGAHLRIDSVISGGVAPIVKNGLGVLELTAVNTFTKPFSINAGKVLLTGAGTLSGCSVITLATNTTLDAAATTLSVAANQTLSGIGNIVGQVNDDGAGSQILPGGTAAAGTLTIDSLTLNGNATLSFDLSTNNAAIGGGTNDLLLVTNLTLSGSATNSVSINALGGTLPKGVPFTIIKYTTCSAPAGVITTLAAPPSHFTYTFNNDAANNRITVTITGNPFNLVWKGDSVTNAWDITTTPNWLVNGVTPDMYYDGDNTTFSDAGSRVPPVNVTTTVKPTTLTVNAASDYTFAGTGKISGGAALVKSGTGNLTLLTANDFSGGGSLNGSGVVNVGNGVASGNLGSGNLVNNTKVNFASTASSTYAGNMSGAGSVSTFMPGATLTFSGVSTYTGGTTISNGTLQIGNNPAVAGSSISGTITNYGTLYYSRSDAFTLANNLTSAGNSFEYGNGDLNIRGAGGMTVDGTAGINILGSISVAQSMYGKLTANSGANVFANGSLLLGNPNNASYNADVIQNGGTITVGNQVRVGHWGSEISTYTMNGGTLNVPNAQLAVGWDGIGLMYMNGGTVNCRTLNVDDNGATAAIGGTNSTFTLNAGRVNVGVGGIGGNTATIALGGGTIAAAAPAGFSSGMAMVFTNGSGVTFDTSNSVITMSGVLSGTNGFVKQGAGYLNVNGANTFTGAVTVAQGTLQGSGTVSGPITVQSGASLSAGGAFAAGTLTVTNLNLNPGAGLTFDLSSTGATGDQLAVRGALALDTATPATFNFLGGTPYTGGPYVLITNWLSGRTGHLVYNSTGSTRYTVAIDESNANRIQATFTGANASLVWNGHATSLWNATDTNWLNGGVLDKYYQSDAVIFDDSGLAKPNVVLASAMTPASITVNSAGTYSFSGGDLVGLGSLTKSGAGTLTLSNNLALLGAITVGAGTLNIGNGGTSGYVDGNIVNFGSVVFNRADPVSYGLNPVNQASAVISGPGSLTQAGAGKLTILSTMNHYGGTTINPGSTIQLGNGPVVDSGSLGNSPVLNNGSVIFYRLSSIAVATPYNGPGSLTFLGTGDAGQSAYSLNATNTFTGPVTLSYARIQSGAGALSFGNPSMITVPVASQVYAVATPYSSVYSIPLTLAGTGWQDSLGALRIENAGTWAGPITLSGNARIGVNNATTNIITGTISGNYELETYVGNASGALVLAPTVSENYSALRVSGASGAVTLAANANAIPNNILLTMNAGTLKLNGFDRSFSSFINLSTSSSIQNSSATTPANVTLTPPFNAAFSLGSFANLNAQPLNVTFNQSGPAATLTVGTTSPNWTGNLTNNGGTILVASGGPQNTGFGNLSIPGRYMVANNGAFSGMNNNWISGGGQTLPTIVLNNSSLTTTRYVGVGPLWLSNAKVISTLNGADSGYYAYQLGGPVTVRGTAPSYITFTGSGSTDQLDLNGVTVFDVADATASPASDLIITMVVRNSAAGGVGTGSLVKIGSGTLELDATPTYTGSTTISNGVLLLGSGTSLPTTPAIVIRNGAKLDDSANGLTLGAQVLTGGGTVVGNLSDGSGTTISPGDAVGTLTVNGDLTLNGSGSLAIDLANVTTVGAGVNDLIQVNGNLTLNTGTPTPIAYNFINGAPAAGTYTLIKYTGVLTGDATGLTNPPTRFGPTYSVDAGSKSILVTFGGAATNLVWTGTDPVTAATWDVNVTTNWFDGTGPNSFYQFDSVRFDDTSVNTTVTLAATVTPTAITFDSTNNYTVSGSGHIAGHTTIAKNNTNTVVLSTVNTFANSTVNVNAGKLALGINEALPASTTVNVAPGAAFDFAGYNNTTTLQGSSYFIAGAGPDGSGALLNDTYDIYSYANVSNLTLTADAVIGGTTRWDIGPNANSKLDGQGHKLVKVGTGNLDMRAQIITNLASLTVSNGLMWYESFSQTNAWTTNTTNFIKPGAVLGNYAGQTVNMPLSLDSATIENYGGSGTPTWTGPIVLPTTSLFNNSALQAFYGPISGPGGININGGLGVLTISNANTYTGGTIISNGPVTASSADATAGSATVVAGNPTALGSGPITISGLSYPSLATNTSFFLTNVFRAVEFNFTAPGTVPNAIVLPLNTVSNVSLHGHDSQQVINLAGVISGGFAGLTNWVDFGDATVLGVMRYGNTANTFLGTLAAFRGVLAITADGSLGNAANVVKLNNANGLRFDAPGINVAHGLLLTASTTFNVYGDNNGDGTTETPNAATISGIISGTANNTINVTGGTNIAGTSYGSLTLSGANTLSDNITIQPNTKLIAANAAALCGTANTVTVNNGATLSLNLGATYNSKALGLAGLGVASGGVGAGALENLSGANTFPGAITLNAISSIGITAGSLTLSGAISGAYPLIKTGPGTLTLSAGNSYTAGTFVNAGTLFVNGSLPVGNEVVVASGATLGGNGTINGPINIQAGAALAPGVNGIGKLTAGSTLTLAGTTTMEISKTSSITNDAVVGLTSVSYGGTLVVNSLGNALTNGDKFILFSALDRQGSFSSLTLPALASGLAWTNLLNVDGSIQVYTLPTVNVARTNVNWSLSGTNLTLTWPADHIGWRLLVQTNNLAAGVSANTNDWMALPASATTNLMVLPIDPTKPTTFYRMVYP